MFSASLQWTVNSETWQLWYPLRGFFEIIAIMHIGLSQQTIKLVFVDFTHIPL